MLNVEVVTTTEGFQALEKEWNQLLAKSAADTIFLTWEWLYTWWEVYGEGKTLQILLARDNGLLVGIAPLFQMEAQHYGFLKLQELHLLGSGEVCSDYLDLIVKQGREREVIQSFIQYIRENHRWDRLVIPSILENSPNVEILRDVAVGSGYSMSMHQEGEYFYIMLPSSWEEYLNLRSRKLRSEIRSDRKRLLQNEGGRLSIVNSGEEVKPTFEMFIQLHQERWEKLGYCGHFTSPSFTEFHRTIAPVFFKKGWLYLATLRVNGAIAAVQYNFLYNGKLYNYLPAFDIRYRKYSVGTVLLSYCLEDLINRGVREFDFLRGDEPFKRRWADYHRSYHKTTLFLPCVKIRLHQMAQAVEQFAKGQVKRLLPSSIVEDFGRLRKNRALRQAAKQGNVH